MKFQPSRPGRENNDIEMPWIRDPESKWLVGDIVELPGCYSQAPDLPSLVTNIREAAQACLDATDLDDPLPDFVGAWRIEGACGLEVAS